MRNWVSLVTVGKILLVAEPVSTVPLFGSFRSVR
jgi:hypothetical protein